jgi:flagellar hook-length control protein FliK
MTSIMPSLPAAGDRVFAEGSSPFGAAAETSLFAALLAASAPPGTPQPTMGASRFGLGAAGLLQNAATEVANAELGAVLTGSASPLAASPETTSAVAVGTDAVPSAAGELAGTGLEEPDQTGELVEAVLAQGVGGAATIDPMATAEAAGPELEGVALPQGSGAATGTGSESGGKQAPAGSERALADWRGAEVATSGSDSQANATLAEVGPGKRPDQAAAAAAAQADPAAGGAAGEAGAQPPSVERLDAKVAEAQAREAVGPAQRLQGGAEGAVRQPYAEALQASSMRIERVVRHDADRLTVVLDPPELGSLEVSLTTRPGHEPRAIILVERVETLDLLQRDLPTLERALANAGVSTGSGGLQLELRQEQQRAHQQLAGTGEPGRPDNRGGEADPRTPSGRPTRHDRLLDLIA